MYRRIHQAREAERQAEEERRQVQWKGCAALYLAAWSAWYGQVYPHVSRHFHGVCTRTDVLCIGMLMSLGVTAAPCFSLEPAHPYANNTIGLVHYYRLFHSSGCHEHTLFVRAVTHACVCSCPFVQAVFTLHSKALASRLLISRTVASSFGRISPPSQHSDARIWRENLGYHA